MEGRLLREVGIGVSSVGVYAIAPGVMSIFCTPARGGPGISRLTSMFLLRLLGDDLWSTAGLADDIVAGSSTLAEFRRAMLGTPGVYE